MNETLLGHRLHQRELHLILLVDVSGSMAPDGKMPALNTAVEEALPHLRRVAEDAPGVAVYVRVLSFATEARWIGDPEPIEDFRWDELAAQPGSLTELGVAIDRTVHVLEQLATRTVVPPAVLLVSDGLPTDVYRPPFDHALARFDGDPLGRAATRMAVGIGRDVDLDTLQRFIGPRGGAPVRADSPQQLMVQVRDQVSVLLRSASQIEP